MTTVSKLRMFNAERSSCLKTDPKQ